MFELKTERLYMVPADLKEILKKSKLDATDEKSEIKQESSGGFWRHFKSPTYPEYVYWEILLKPDNTYIGYIRVRTLPVDGSAEMEFEIESSYRGMGYATEAVNKASAFKLIQRDLYFIVTEVENENTAAIRVLEKCGFIKIRETTGGELWAKEKEKLYWLKPSLGLSLLIICCSTIIGIAGGNAGYVLLIWIILMTIYPISFYFKDRRKRRQYKSSLSEDR